MAENHIRASKKVQQILTNQSKQASNESKMIKYEIKMVATADGYVPFLYFTALFRHYFISLMVHRKISLY
jgi:hypothetical protein